MIQELIAKHFTISQTAATSPALHYIAGYVCQKVKKNIEASKHADKGVLLLCLMDLRDEDEDMSEGADWVHAVNRGGLCLVSETMAMLFHKTELLVGINRKKKKKTKGWPHTHTHTNVMTITQFPQNCAMGACLCM